MKTFLMVTTAAICGATVAGAAGVERNAFNIEPLFEKGNYAEFSFRHVTPTVKGRDASLFGGLEFDDVANSFNSIGMAYKRDFGNGLSGAVILEQPFGADLNYPYPNPAAGEGSIALGGTEVTVKSTSLTGLLRYKMENNFGVHGGLRIDRAEGNVKLRGLAYGPVNGYDVDLDSDVGIGWVAGVSYEIPEYAARVSLTYNSAIKHSFDTTEKGPLVDPDGPGPYPALPLLNGDSKTKVKTPSSLALDFQTGIAADTLLFGQIRWTKWSEFKVDPENFTKVTGEGLVDLDNSTAVMLGVGRKFNENWAGSVAVNWESRDGELVSPLAPTSGKKGITLAAIYTRDNMKITTGINYTKLGDASPETSDDARAKTRNNELIGVGMKVGFTF
ncbi:OmpP1/FadL family transporter [Paracoccus pacificus]|uniref:OmpP1/FadL family transporter n=1 Tax=Paracoccus pacificus TaxID=1463598 RepID=A0ABW4R950_9RHOB